MNLMSLDGLLNAVSTALGVVKSIAATPGVNLLPYVSTIESTANVLQFAIKAGASVADDIAAFADTFSSGVPSQEKLDALDARIAKLRSQLHAPLPEKEEGEE